MRVKFGIPVEGFGTYGAPQMVDIVSWHSGVGDVVAQNALLVTVAAEKVDTDLSAPVSGTLVQVNYEANETWYSVGEEDTPFGRILLPELCVIETDSASIVSTSGEPSRQDIPEKDVLSTDTEARPKRVHVSPVAQRMLDEQGIVSEAVRGWLPAGVARISKEDVENYIQHLQEQSQKTSGDGVRAVPAARQKAREAGIDIRNLRGTGKDGTILVSDAEAAIGGQEKEPVEKPDSVDVYRGIPVDVLTPSRRRSIIARNMAEAWQAPLAGGTVDVNVHKLFTLHEKLKRMYERDHNEKLRLHHFVMAACAYLLAQPEFRILNSCWIEDGGQASIMLYRDVNLGMAVAMPASQLGTPYSELAIPVMKQADQVSFLGLVKESNRLVEGALSGKPGPGSESGVTFIVNNVGAPVQWRGMSFPGDEHPNPIIAPGTAAILAFGAARVEWGGKKMALTLRFDHRVCDGHEAIRFLRVLQYYLEHPEGISHLR